MDEREEQGGRTRAMVYCLVPRELAARVHEPLRRAFAADQRVEVVVERREADRRAPADRRVSIDVPLARDEKSGATDVPGARDDQRRIRNAAGRRIADRRATAAPSSQPELPRRLRPYADRLVFVERIEPTSETMLDADSARLVTRFQAGEREAFTELYLRYFERVFSYLRVLFREDPHEAEDLTQQVFTKVFAALPRYERRSQPFRAWLFTIVRNEALQQLGKRGRSDVIDPAELTVRMEADEPEGIDTDGVDPALAWITDRELLMFVERLTLPQRQVLLLRYMLDLTTRQIGEILGRSTDDVRMLDSRARRFLEQRLAALGRTPHGKRSRMQWRRQVKLAPVIRQRRFALHR